MLHSTSLKFRLAVSVGANILRAMISFVTGLLIARSLNPARYGDLMFLLGSFVAIRSLLDMGSSSAFFTFLSQRTRGHRFYGVYLSWLMLQFVVTLTLLWLIISSSLFEKVWLGHDRMIVLLAFVAAFMQQQVWQTVGQIGEAMRKTVKVQLMNLTVACLYFVILFLMSRYGNISIEKILFTIILQYAAATTFSYIFLKNDWAKNSNENSSVKEIIFDYFEYCKPLALLAVVSFSYDFADKWMLQKFSGSVQQGYFQIASQFAAVSLLATTAILNVFWKEIANAWEKKDQAKVAMLYHKISRALVMLGAIISGLLLPWSEQIVGIFLGSEYVNSWPVLAVMLLYPIHQSMGQIGGTMFLASGQTQKYMLISIAMMLISIPLSYLMLASTTDRWLPGLAMGALGMACKMVALGVVSVNIQAWVIARCGGWKFDWHFQIVVIPMVITVGLFAKTISGMLWEIEGVEMVGLMAPIVFACILYLFFVIAIIFWQPWLIGADRAEIEKMFGRLMRRKA